MMGKTLTLTALAAALLLGTSALAGQAKPGATPAAPAAGQTPAPRPRLAPPVRGEAELAYTQPVPKAAKIEGKDFIVTTIRVKNMSSGAIAGLKVDEFWYNKAGDPVTGDTFRNPRPLQPGEVITVTLETPRNPQMAGRPNYKFEHANGAIKMKLVPKL
jgi:hypothetical protein